MQYFPRIVLALMMATAFGFCAQTQAEIALNEASLEIPIGGAKQLVLKDGKSEGLRWESSAPQIAEVFPDGFVIGLTAGEARIFVRKIGTNEAAECVIKILPDSKQLIDPATLRQYADNRQFTNNGRRCFGSELNGQRASDPNERRFTRSNRVINPKPLRADKPLEWELKPGTEVYDGAGILMGTVPPTRDIGGRRVPVSKFNFGASKVLHGRLCVYAFSITIKPSEAVVKLIEPAEKNTGKVSTSAWLPLDSVMEKEALLERIGMGKARLPALPLETTGYRVTGGDPRAYFTEFGELSIVRQVVENGPVPSHYLRRPSGTINLIYSVPGFGLGGQGADSFLVGESLKFYPAKGAKVFQQPTYYPVKHPQKGKVSPQTMTFLYGAIKSSGIEPVYGWIAKEALTAESGR